jgi:hypothetical protein
MGNRQTLFQDYAVWNANTITVINKARLEGGKGFEVISLLMTSKHLSILTKFGAMGNSDIASGRKNCIRSAKVDYPT